MPTPPPEKKMLKDQKSGLRKSDHVNSRVLINAGIVIKPEMIEVGLSPDLSSTGDDRVGIDSLSPIPESN